MNLNEIILYRITFYIIFVKKEVLMRGEEVMSERSVGSLTSVGLELRALAATGHLGHCNYC